MSTPTPSRWSSIGVGRVAAGREGDSLFEGTTSRKRRDTDKVTHDELDQLVCGAAVTGMVTGVQCVLCTVQPYGMCVLFASGVYPWVRHRTSAGRTMRPGRSLATLKIEQIKIKLVEL